MKQKKTASISKAPNIPCSYNAEIEAPTYPTIHIPSTQTWHNIDSIQEFYFHHPNSNWKTTQTKKAKIPSTMDGMVILPNHPSPQRKKTSTTKII